MSEFDKLKDQAEQYAKEHPEQVKKGEQAVEEKLGMDTQEEETSQHDQNTPPQDSGQQGN